MNTRLHPDHDADLIEWWQAQPKGKGSATIKAALRAFIASGTDAAPVTKADMAKVASGMDQLIRLVAHLTQKVERGVVVQTSAPAAEADEQLSEDQVVQRERRIRERKW